MSHSKRNTSLAFFTSHERSLLRSTWGSQSTRLNRDSFLPFGSCQLCLLPSQDPVACGGVLVPSTSITSSSTDEDPDKRRRNKDRAQCHIFCRECLMANLLTQRKEMKRMESATAAQRVEAEEAEAREEEEARKRTVEDFERVQIGLGAKPGGGRIVERGDGRAVVVVEGVQSEAGGKGTKRKFELDEDELLRIAKEDRSRARRALDDERTEASKSALPSFWTPSASNASRPNLQTSNPSTTKKSQPLCPGSTSSTRHTISLKSFIPVQFTSESTTSHSIDIAAATGKTRSCPACSRALTNSSKAVLTKPCGHVLCGSCVDKFMVGGGADSLDEDGAKTVLRCFVCSADLTRGDEGKGAKGKEKGKEKEKEKEKLWPGLLDISSEGTGFAGGGGNVVKREGVAFQC